MDRVVSGGKREMTVGRSGAMSLTLDRIKEYYRSRKMDRIGRCEGFLKAGSRWLTGKDTKKVFAGF